RRGEEALRFCVCVGGNSIDSDHEIRSVELRRRFELRAIGLNCVVEITGCEMCGVCVGKSHGRGELRAEQARSENPDWNVRAASRYRMPNLSGLRRSQQHLEFDNVLRELIRAEWIATQGAQCAGIRARRATESEIDAARIESLEGSELFCDHERRMIRQ